MFRFQPAAGTPAYKREECPDEAAPRRSVRLLPRLITSDGGAGLGSPSRWWQGLGSQRLPCLCPVTSYAPPGRGSMRALLLPPLRTTSTTRGAGTQGTRQTAARKDPDSLGTLLGELLPSKFRDFLHQLRAKCSEPEAPSSSEPQYRRGTSAHCLGSQCPSCSFLPDVWDQSFHSEHSFKEKPTLGPRRSEFITAKKTNQSSGEGSRPRRRYCPFRVRFADETLQDTALRYWERNRSVRQNIFSCEQTSLPAVSVSERVLGSVGRWLESLPRTLRPRAQDTGSLCWNRPRVASQEPQLYFSEDATMSSRLPFISPAATTQRPRGGLRTFLDTPNTVEQEFFLPSLVLQSILKQSRSKSY